MNKLLLLGLATTTAALVAACGGGGSSPAPDTGTDPNDPTGGIDRGGIRVLGTINGFGSVLVNGRRFEVGGGTTIVIDGQPGTEADLAVGEIVYVAAEAPEDDGIDPTADLILADDAVEGPVQSMDLAANRLVVLGQTVAVGVETSFDDFFQPGDLSALALDDVIEVYGLRRADGSIAATRIEPGDGDFEVTGVVEVLDAGVTEFRIGDLVVDYGAATLEDFAAGGPQNGDLVEARGDALGAAGELVATRLENRGADLVVEDDDEAEIEGFVTRFASSSDFDVSGFPVTTTASTVFEGGAAGDLALDVRVEVDGEIDAAGVLVAEEIEIKRPAAIRVAARVDAVDAGAGTLTLLGIEAATGPATRFEDQSDAGLRPFELGDVAVGDYLAVRGVDGPPSGAAVEARVVEREDDADGVELIGFVDSIAEPGFTVLGVTIETNADTEFQRADGQEVSQAEFFAALVEGTLIDVEGTEIGERTVLAEEVELEGDDDD